eukprot:m.186474 g.186474  ORF g.186474 m.186474 type:complete len:922 (+) comp16782_c0_seq1:76-2841(+)
MPPHPMRVTMATVVVLLLNTLVPFSSVGALSFHDPVRQSQSAMAAHNNDTTRHESKTKTGIQTQRDAVAQGMMHANDRREGGRRLPPLRVVVHNSDTATVPATDKATTPLKSDSGGMRSTQSDGMPALTAQEDMTTTTVYDAAVRVRALLASNPGRDVHVLLAPGLHRIDTHTGPLILGPHDGGQGGAVVTWMSMDPSHPAVIGAPVSVSGPWTRHPTVPNALSAPLPTNITVGTPLRQFWVNGRRATRPLVYGHGTQPGDNRNGNCLNLTNVSRTDLYPNGQAFDFTYENATDPSTWTNPSDVEFVYTSCDAINCWIEPRCTVESVDGSVVKLKQDGNESCFHRLYYYAQCFDNGKGPGRTSYRGMNPTTLENVASNWTQPGEFYYDRAAGRIGYIPRPGETAATLATTAVTATAEQLLVVNGTANLVWHNVQFQYATWQGASGNKGYIDTQSAYLCQDGEPPVNIALVSVHNVTFHSCGFAHLGAVYALGVSDASQSVAVINSTFTDISGGGVKLGSVGERGAPSPPVTLDPSLQDRGYVVSDCEFTGIPTEYRGANPIFAGYVADTNLVHNTIHDSTYSGICAGWGWGMSSYVRNINILNNSITMPMQRLADGGAVYTNTPCYDCHVSGNYFASDPAVYGCLYHDGGSGLWNDENNVFNNVTNHIIFTHGDSQHTTVNNVWYNNSQGPNLQGDTNNDVRDANGKCINVSITALQPHQPWPAPALAIIQNAGRRTSGNLPTTIAFPALSPPSPHWPPPNYTECHTHKPGPPGPPGGAFSAKPCDPSAPSQQWVLSNGVTPGDGRVTNVKLATAVACWEITACAEGDGASVGCGYGCKPIPTSCASHCDCNGAWSTNPNGTITSVMDGKCLQVSGGAGSAVNVATCTGKANQVFKFVPSGVKVNNTYAVQQGTLCVDQAV